MLRESIEDRKRHSALKMEKHLLTQMNQEVIKERKEEAKQQQLDKEKSRINNELNVKLDK